METISIVYSFCSLPTFSSLLHLCSIERGENQASYLLSSLLFYGCINAPDLPKSCQIALAQRSNPDCFEAQVDYNCDSKD
jgi:hypothetical protein